MIVGAVFNSILIRPLHVTFGEVFLSFNLKVVSLQQQDVLFLKVSAKLMSC